MNNFWTTHTETTILWFIFSASSPHSFVILLFLCAWLSDYCNLILSDYCNLSLYLGGGLTTGWPGGLSCCDWLVWEGETSALLWLVIKLLAIPGGTPISSVIGSFAETGDGLQTALLLMESLWNRVDPRKRTTFLVIASSWVLLADSCNIHYPGDYSNQVFRAGKFPGEPLYGNTLKALIGGMYIYLALNYHHLPPFCMEPPFETEMWRHGLSVGLHSFHSAFCCQVFTR